MKRINIYYILLTLCLYVFASCEDVKYETIGEALPKIQNAVANVENGDINLTWDKPAIADSFAVQIVHNGSVIELPDSPAGYVIENAEVKIDHSITLKIRTLAQESEGVTLHVSLDGPNPVSNLKAARDGSDIKLSWELPETIDANAIEINWDENQKAEITPVTAADTTYTIKNTDGSKRYTIAVRTKTSTAYSHFVYAVANTEKYGFVTTFDDINAIQDDDELAAAKWFISTYPTAEIVPVSKIQSGEVALGEFSVLWIHIDRIGDGKLPNELLDRTVTGSISDFYKNGGNLLLSIHATQYLSELGRINKNRNPGIIGAGAGGFGNDTWTINPNIGMTYDHFNHPIYKELPVPTIPDFGHPSIPVIGPGQREDHNCMWDLNSFGYSIPTDGENVVKAFESENNATVIGTWGHVTDFCCAGIVDFNPTTTYKGRCIAIGMAAYEWNQNSGVNQYQGNIEKMTANVINYLR
ncbi:MAG: DUF4960 domain-containing protein [Dysgonomonas sp.]